MAIRNTTPGGRTLKLLGVGARTLGRSLIKNLPLGGDQAERSLRYWTEVGSDMVKTLGELRGAAMKLGQLASQYSDVLPPALAQQLQLLQRSATPLPFSEIEPLLKAQWSPAQRKAVRHIEPVAMAAASIGQVHRATLIRGEAVVIKLRYPGVREAVDADLSQLRRLIAASKLLPLDDAAMDRLMAEVRERFKEETDYTAELAHLQHLRQAAALPGIVYATPHPALCTDGILVMGEERGETLETAAGWSQPLRDALGARLCEWLAHGMFEARAVHADPHPGNFAFRVEGQVVVYDMGCVKRVPAPVVAQVSALLNAAIAEDWQGLHTALIALQGVGAEVPLAKVQTLYADFTTLILHRLLAEEHFDFGAPGFIEDIRKAGRKHLLHTFTFQPVSDLIFVMRALSGLYWMLRRLNAVVPVRAVLAAHGISPDGLRNSHAPAANRWSA
jgi:predicted unusual protein kinase regulating ubiquinone biosynthesis (AarF/ABC1/UbiB family)